jgi:adenosine kinase
VTLGPAGVRIEREGEPAVVVPAVPGVRAVEPTGVGDAFRAGYIGAVVAGVSTPCAAAIGCVLAAYVVERIGTQEYAFSAGEFLSRLRGAYGDETADEAAAWLEPAAGAAGTATPLGHA